MLRALLITLLMEMEATRRSPGWVESEKNRRFSQIRVVTPVTLASVRGSRRPGTSQRGRFTLPLRFQESPSHVVVDRSERDHKSGLRLAPMQPVCNMMVLGCNHALHDISGGCTALDGINGSAGEL